jgi:hypothetical protein
VQSIADYASSGVRFCDNIIELRKNSDLSPGTLRTSITATGFPVSGQAHHRSTICPKGQVARFRLEGEGVSNLQKLLAKSEGRKFN